MPDPETPRPEHPRPQFFRETWLTLNGEWEFEIDQGDSGLERGLLRRALVDRILVPFAPESSASGIGDTDFLHAVWYRRVVRIPATWEGQSVLLHFGAVDHDATIWVDGVEVGRHRGGFTSFTVDVTAVAVAGRQHTIVVRARDSRWELQARGKQATWYENSHANYTRTTGIWQSVWIEAVPQSHLRDAHVRQDAVEGRVDIEVSVRGQRPGLLFRATIGDEDGWSGTATASARDLVPTVVITIPAERKRLWNPGDAFLYDLRLELLEGEKVIDSVTSYVGLRSIGIDDMGVTINGKHVFQRLVLDQGYWPDTLMTAPTDGALVTDIKLAMAAGFNGARLHQKVFEERYHYHADRLGFLVWGEFGDWGISGAGFKGNNQSPTASFITQWIEAVQRDRNHPCIIGWCPLNETRQLLHDRITVLDDVTRGMFLAAKAADGSRPVIDASGYAHRVSDTDIYDAHSYEQDPERFRTEQAGLADGRPFVNTFDDGPISIPYEGQPYFISEFGGIWWNPDVVTDADSDDRTSWGYGERVVDEDAFYRRFAGLVDVLAANPRMFGYCYTQLTDVFQEQNGLYRFDRTEKLDIGRIAAAQRTRAAFEKVDDIKMV